MEVIVKKYNFKFLYIILLLSACSTSKPSKFYNIISVENCNSNLESNINIGVELVNIANYLNRPQIVTLKNETEFNISETNRWLESLQYSLQSAITDNLSICIKNSKVKKINFKEDSFDYTILVDVIKLDGKFNDKVQLDAWYTIKKNNKIVKTERVKLNKKLTKDIEVKNYKELVKIQSDLIGELSVIIAKNIINKKY